MAGVEGEKISPSGTGAILETPPLPPGRGVVEISCVTYEFPEWFCHLFIFLSVRGASSKTGLNCWLSYNFGGFF